MTDVVLRTGPGQPTKLSATKQRVICDAVALGLTWIVAAQRANVAYASLMHWKRWGQEAALAVAAALSEMSPELWERIDDLDDEYRTDGQPTARDLELEQMIPVRQRPYYRLWRGIERAQAQFETQHVALLNEAGRGYDEEETVTVTKRDPQGNIIEETRTVRQRRARHWQASAWLLERRIPERYAQLSRTEHTGLGGGPIEVEHTAADKLQRLSGVERDTRSAQVLAILAEAERIDVEVLADVVVDALPEPHGNGESSSRGSDDTAADAVHPDHPDA